MPARIPIDREKIAAFCKKWKVKEFALFGSVLRDDFGPDSDVDVMVAFEPTAHWGLEFVSMAEELEEMFGRSVDLTTRAAVERSPNWIVRSEILRSVETLHAA